MKSLLLAATALAFCTSAHAQIKTFSSVAPDKWQRGQPWAPNFQPAAADMACAWSGTNPIPVDANPISFSSSGIQIAVYPTPPDYTITGQPYICGEVTTRSTFSFLYGYVQGVIKMPSTAGTSAGFWMNAVDGSWPPEIDITEEGKNMGLSNLYQHIHSVDAGDSNWGTPNYNTPDLSQGFHTYAVDWEADYITFYFDGVQTGRVTTPSDMHKAMYLLLDIDAGTPSSWEGSPNGDILDAMLVSSVEVWTSNPHLPPPAAPTAAQLAASANNVVVGVPTGAPAPAPAPGQSNPSAQAAIDAKIAAAQAQMAPVVASAEASEQQEISAARAPRNPSAAVIRQEQAEFLRNNGEGDQ
jgi:hypothetical protein